ncbi:MAG TPA: IPT/TIG domain-containing protein [Bryobacteraceae bacterium]|nr:IPT/TIG domain-containing protein [Bryobacteraceae bacterium]
MRLKIALSLFLFVASALQSSAQPALDSSGNGLLKGVYYLRQVFYFVADESGALGGAINIQGTITFDGKGSYSFTGSMLDTAANSTTPKNFNTNGSYVIAASGLGYITGIDPEFSTDHIAGLVSHGIFIGSTTDNMTGYNDLLIAAPVGSTAASNGTLKGTYTVAYLDPTFPGDALFTMTANGQGGIGNVSATEYLATDSTSTAQDLTNVSYSFSNGAAQLNFGGQATSTTLIGGTETLYVSPDGNLVFGGSSTGFDIFVGVRGATNNPSNYDGLYYQAGLDLNEGTVSFGYTLLDSYYGSLQAFSTNIVGHQRLNSVLLYGGARDFTYYDSYTLNNDGSSDDFFFAQHYISSPDGTIRIGSGLGPYLSLNVALQAPALTGPGVYLSPVGVVNAASSAPFTAQVVPGEFLTLYGSGLSSGVAAAAVPFPTALNGVQVLINQRPAPIYYVSPNQISVIVPYATESLAQIQVVNNGMNSNVVTQSVGSTSIGVFTNNPVGGIGYAAALHPDYSLVSLASPAQIGETVAVYLTGMGAVSPPIADGVAAPVPPANTTLTPLVFLLDSAGNYPQATVTFSGLAPGFAGLYQINFKVPDGLVPGDAALEIVGPDSDTFESLISIASATGTSSAAHARPRRANRVPMGHMLSPRQFRGGGRWR